MPHGAQARERSAWRGFWAGAVAGLAASWVMNQFQSAIASSSSTSSQGEAADNATTRAAETISHLVRQRDLAEDEKARAGAFVHYMFGSSMGAAYGMLSELVPTAAVDHGAMFGAALWLGADEIAVPALRLSGLPQECPASTHFSALAAHLVYGLTTDTIRRVIRATY